MRDPKLFAIILIAAILAGCSTPGAKEPTYKGTSLSDWMDGLTNLWSGEESRAHILERQQIFTNLVCSLGTNALPYYVEGLCSDKAGRAFGSSLAFQILGPAAEPALPSLVRILHDEKNANKAEGPLVSIGPAAIPSVINAAETITNRGRTAAILTLGQFGTNASAASQFLVEMINTNSPSTRDAAMRALIEIDPNRNRFAPLFAQHLASSNGCFSAAYALGRLGQPGIPFLIGALTNAPRNIRAAAEGALDPEFQKFAYDRPGDDHPSFMHVSSSYNLFVLKAASRNYSQGDFQVASETAKKHLQDANPEIRIAASNAVHFLAPFVATNVPQMKIDEEKEADVEKNPSPRGN